MKVKFLKTALLGFVISVSSLVNVANAGLINIGALTSNDDGSTTVIDDSLNSLEWLRWDQLADLTHDETLAQIASAAYSGWNIAGINETNMFLNALYNGSADECGINLPETIAQCQNPGAFPQAEYAALTGGANLIGGQGLPVWFHVETTQEVTAGYFIITQGGNVTVESAGISIERADEYSANGMHSATPISWLLYRTAMAAPVPEPSTLAIFALGMMGLASRRFKKQS